MRRTEVDILFFDGYSRDPSKWKSAWTQRSHPDVCWPEKWLPAGLEFDVRLLFVSYHGQPSVADVVDDLFKTLVIRDEWDLCKNHQSLALIGLGYGALVLNDLFHKAMKGVVTSSTGAGAFMRNLKVKGVATTLPEEHHLDIGQVYAGRVYPGTGMLGLNLWEYFMKLNIMKWPGTEIAERGSSILRTREFKDTFMEIRQAQATSSQMTLGVTGGCKSVTSASASFAGPVESTLESSQCMMEMPSHFVSGTGFCAECLDVGGPKPIARVDLNFGWSFQQTNSLMKGSRRSIMACSAQYTLISKAFGCSWIKMKPVNEFQVERHVCEPISVAQPQPRCSLINPKTWFTGKQKPLCDCNKMLETYKVKLYINHRMSNTDTLPQSGIDMVC
ncbi:unnamed protein product [Sphagnum jensenii]|uniref:Uncharacterized protein n=1 Tax=Sphagnum jensenii TaxID=128206 RepID=A0ABP1AZS7_9BRYO